MIDLQKFKLSSVITPLADGCFTVRVLSEFPAMKRTSAPTVSVPWLDAFAPPPIPALTYRPFAITVPPLIVTVPPLPFLPPPMPAPSTPLVAVTVPQ